ncbi:MAG: hypothetical protein JST09_11950, partial [Bacteroidetes bacterium]|nr:hypothetical protein [Bacteroidota bacterium]
TISGLTTGQYTFELRVTDDKGASSKAQVKVTVNAAPNQAPVANAGPDKTITLPIDSIVLDGSASSDINGIITLYKWVKLSGGAATITNDSTPIIAVLGLEAGQYIFELTVADDKKATSRAQVRVTVNAISNHSPVANAGPNQIITLPTDTITLDGSKSMDGDGSIVSYKWTELSGGIANIASDTASITTVSGLEAGQYTFELTVTDNKGATSKGLVKIIVNLGTDLPPVAIAGANQVINLPVNKTQLDGTKSYDPDGAIISFRWSKKDGPSLDSIVNADSSTPVLLGLTAGIYTFELTITDDRGAFTKAQVKVFVQQILGNDPPVADAGPDQTITLPGSNKAASNSIKLNGSNSYDPDGNIVYYNWTKLDGASAVTINGVNTSESTVSGLKPGEYTFVLTVTDNKGAMATDQVTILVKSNPDQPPVANAGADIVIVSPESTAVLDGTASYDNLGNLTYRWEEIQGPDTAILSSSAASKVFLKNLVVGKYIFKLTVTDNRGTSASDDVQITVIERPQAVQVELYPNPASGIINAKIISDSIGVIVLNIYDMNGRALKKVELNKQLVDNLRLQIQRPNVNQPNPTRTYLTLPINIASLKSGVYILETILDMNTRSASKFIKY